MLGIGVALDHLGVWQWGRPARQSLLSIAHTAVVVTRRRILARWRRAEPSSVNPFTTKGIMVSAVFGVAASTPAPVAPSGPLRTRASTNQATGERRDTTCRLTSPLTDQPVYDVIGSA